MFKTPTANRAGYAILTVGVVVGLWAGYKNDQGIKSVNRVQSEIIAQQEKFIIQQCDRDKLKDQVIIGALRDAKRRAIHSLAGDPVQMTVAVAAIQKSIDGIKHSTPCVLPKIKDD